MVLTFLYPTHCFLVSRIVVAVLSCCVHDATLYVSHHSPDVILMLFIAGLIEWESCGDLVVSVDNSKSIYGMVSLIQSPITDIL